MADEMGMAGLHNFGLDEVRRNWGWFLGLGVLLTVFGVVAIGAAAAMTIVSMIFFGWLLIFAGALEAVHSFWRKAWGGFFVDLLAGLLYLVIGVLLVANPAASAVTLTLLLALVLIFGGVFRIAIALAVRYPNWSWLMIHGVVNLLLGILIMAQWPVSGLWVIGLFIGIDLLFNGVALIMLGMAARGRSE